MENKKPDWDKITEGKIRHGFAVAAFESRMKLTSDLADSINNWVKFVVSGELPKGVKNNQTTTKPVVNKLAKGHISGALNTIMPKSIVKQVNEEIEIEHIIKEKIRVLSKDKQESVLESLKRGDITKDNLQGCLERINALSNDKK